MSTAKPKTKDEEFTRFRDLAGKLVAVPKQEVDAQKAKYEREKESKEKGPATK